MLAVGTVVPAAGARLAVGVGSTTNKADAPPLYLLASPLEQPSLEAATVPWSADKSVHHSTLLSGYVISPVVTCFDSGRGRTGF